MVSCKFRHITQTFYFNNFPVVENVYIQINAACLQRSLKQKSN